MNWAHIAGGANGLIGYSFSILLNPKYSPVEEFPMRWKSICAAYAEVKRFTDILLSESYMAVSGAVDGVPVRAWSHNGTLCVLVCNARASETEVSVRLGKGMWRLDRVELGDGTGVRTDDEGRTLTFKLPTRGISLCRLTER